MHSLFANRKSNPLNLPRTPNFTSTSDTLFNAVRTTPSSPRNRACEARTRLTNVSVMDTCFGERVNNTLSAKDRKKKALKELGDGSPSIGFTGKSHPLSDDAEYKSGVALQLDTSDAHNAAADAHDKAADKMGEFMGQTGPLKHKDYGSHLAGLKAAHTHHKTRAKNHRVVADVLAKDEQAKAEEEKSTKADKSKESAKIDKKDAKAGKGK